MSEYIRKIFEYVQLGMAIDRLHSNGIESVDAEIRVAKEGSVIHKVMTDLKNGDVADKGYYDMLKKNAELQATNAMLEVHLRDAAAEIEAWMIGGDHK